MKASTDPKLTVPFVGAADAPLEPRVTLESDPRLTHSAVVYTGDLDQMLARAKSGMSAYSYLVDRCRAASIRPDGVLVVRLSCLAWPSSSDLHYELMLPDGAVPRRIEPLRLPRRRNVWVSGNRYADLPWHPESATATWREPGALDGRSAALQPAPSLRVENARLLVDADNVFGIALVEGTAFGYRHVFDLEFAKFDGDRIGWSYELQSVPVVATWTGTDGEQAETALDVPVPECARSLLARCDDGRPRIRIRVKQASKKVTEIAYSTCTGAVLGRRVVSGEDER